MAEELLITKPDDWHVHFREGDVLNDTVNATSQHFERALVMPNLITPLTDFKSLEQYRNNILAASRNKNFYPYMTFYLNKNVNPDELKKKSPFIIGAKLYPHGATTNSSAGTKSINTLYPLFEVMQEENLVLQIHGEIAKGDVFLREALFVEQYLTKIIADFPKLRIILEHISTKKAVEFIKNAPETVGATITAHHLFFNRSDLFQGGIRPHYFCLPVLKESDDQKALIKAARSGNKKFFAGTDSAPHAKSQKESSCGCAGIYSAPIALNMYAQIFNDKMSYLENFISHFGADFYQVKRNKSQLTLIKKPMIVPESYPFGKNIVIPPAAGLNLSWSVL